MAHAAFQARVNAAIVWALLLSLISAFSAQAEGDEKNRASVALFGEVLTEKEPTPVGGPGRAARRSNNAELEFTFDSPANPWNPAELTQLRDAVRDLYPMAKTVYGPPAFALTVNIYKGEPANVAGEYQPGAHQICLRSANQVDVLCHEMLHAFRDTSWIRLLSFEEGMVRAAEVEIFNRLPAYVYPIGKHHSYSYDVYYDGLNKPAIGSRDGNLFSGYVSVLLRYQLAGYAWGKALLENPAFLRTFNAQLYASAASTPSILSDERALVALASAIQPAVEGKPFARWYAEQCVLNTRPPAGYWLYHRINQFTLDLFLRDDNGREQMLAHSPISHASFDWRESLMGYGEELTSEFGWTWCIPEAPPDYSGRVRMTANALAPDGTAVTDVSYGYLGEQTGLFGVVEDRNSGTVEILPLDSSNPPTQVPVVNGAFVEPAWSSVPGRFLATFTDASGASVTRQFTKDASDYFLCFNMAAPQADLVVSQAPAKKNQGAGNQFAYVVSVTNSGDSPAKDVVLLQRTPAGATLRSATLTGNKDMFVSSSSAAGGMLVVNLDGLSAKTTAWLNVTLSFASGAPTPANLESTVYTGSIDPNAANNRSTLIFNRK